jgi:DNA-binding response OmpR family regulator
MQTLVLVECDSRFRLILTSYLEAQGYQVLPASDSTEAVRQLRQESVQAVLVDLGGSSHGFELLKILRSQTDLNQMPVLALLDPDDSSEALDYLNPGDYLAMPFEMPVLAWRLQELLPKSNLFEVTEAAAL